MECQSKSNGVRRQTHFWLGRLGDRAIAEVLVDAVIGLFHLFLFFFTFALCYGTMLILEKSALSGSQTSFASQWHFSFAAAGTIVSSIAHPFFTAIVSIAFPVVVDDKVVPI